MKIIKKLGEIIKLCKTNNKVFYAISVMFILIILALVLKIDFTKDKSNIQERKETVKKENSNGVYDEYVANLEDKVEAIIGEIYGVESVKAMIYTKNSPKLEPIYNESKDEESNVETNQEGVKKEVKRDTVEKNVEIKKDSLVVEKYYEYPKVSGVLIVITYNGNDNIYKILTSSIKALLNVDMNNIEVIVSRKGGGNL